MINSETVYRQHESVASLALDVLEKYFRGKPCNDDKVERALKATGAYSRVRASRANEAAIAVAIAKNTGRTGKELDPIFQRLTEQPKLSDQSSGARKKAA